MREHGETESGDLEAEDTNNRQLVLHANFDDEEDSEDDEDFMPGDDEDLDGNEESESESEVDEDETMEGETEEQERVQPSATSLEEDEDSILSNISNESMRAKVRKLHSAFPAAPMIVCRDVLDGSRNIIKEAYITMCGGFEPTMPISAFTKSSAATVTVAKSRSKKRKAPLEDIDSDSIEVETAQGDESLLAHYDQNGLPPGSISTGKALSDMAKALRTSPGKARPTSQRSNSVVSNKSVRFSLDEHMANGLTSTPAIDQHSQVDDSVEDSEESSSDAESGSSSGSSDNSSEEESSSDESSSDDSSSDEDEAENTKEVSDDSLSDSEDSSDDDAPEETSSKIQEAFIADSVTSSDKTSALKPLSKLPANPPGEGRRSTQARNKRRRNANALNRYKQKGILPAGTTSVEFEKLRGVVTETTSPEDALDALKVVRSEMAVEASDKSDSATKTSKDFEARRKQLLDSLQSGGVEVGPDSPIRSEKAPKVRNDEALPDANCSSAPNEANSFSTAPESQKPIPNKRASQTKSPDDVGTAADAMVATPVTTAPSSTAKTTAGIVAEEATTTTSATKLDASTSNPSSATAPRRAKLDLAAGRRMLFGSLGFKTPKSKQDEDKVRDGLMKYVRPVHTPKATANDAKDDNDEVEDENPEAWREKMTYRAVECCEDGVELSEPPFPFVQRWDPQQQCGWPQNGSRGGKRKKNQRDEPQFYQDERPSKKQKKRKNKHSYAEEQEHLDNSYEPSYQEDSMIESAEPTQETRLQSDDLEDDIARQLMNDINDLASAEISQVSQGPEDLAALPEDCSTLSDLKHGQARPGMTIAYKELYMSEETNWQPEISPYRTAVVNMISDNGKLQLTLALRDRTSNEKMYDAETGERRYGKFEMPDEDEDAEEEEDDGIRTITFAELVEPKVVQEAPADLDVDVSENGTALPKVSSSAESQTLSHEREEEEGEAADVQYSHVTETPLNSDAPESHAHASQQDSIRESPQPNADSVDQGMARVTHPEESTPKPLAHLESVANGNADVSITWTEEDTSAILEEPDLPIAPDARMK